MSPIPKSLPEADFPPGLHQKIMRRVWLLKLRPTLITIAALFFINLALASWRLGVNLAEKEAYYLFQTILQDLQWNWDSLIFFLRETAALFETSLMVEIVLNILLLGYLTHLTGLFTKSPIATDK